jgi:hypothetical protein
VCVALSPVRCPKGVRDGSNDNKGEQKVDTNTPIAEERLVESERECERVCERVCEGVCEGAFQHKQFLGGTPFRQASGWRVGRLLRGCVAQ